MLDCAAQEKVCERGRAERFREQGHLAEIILSF
jgi:hypothetical protein